MRYVKRSHKQLLFRLINMLLFVEVINTMAYIYNSFIIIKQKQNKTKKIKTKTLKKVFNTIKIPSEVVNKQRSFCHGLTCLLIDLNEFMAAVHILCVN